MNEQKLSTFVTRYRANLEAAIKAHPEDYPWYSAPTVIYGNIGGPTVLNDTFETVMGRVHEAIRKNSYNKDGRAFRATCKELGIKHTYKAIDEYLER